MMNIKNIIDFTTSKSLILLDEIGTGTDPNSSMAIAQSILEEFSTKKNETNYYNSSDEILRTGRHGQKMLKMQ